MHPTPNQRIALPPAFHRLAWSNLLAQSAEQISLAAAPLVAVFLLGASAAQTGLLQTAQTLTSCCSRCLWASMPTVTPDAD